MLYVSWPELFETSVVDSESYTDLEPLQAKDWSVSIKYYENPSCLLSDALTEFLGVCSGTRTVQELIGDIIQRNQAQGIIVLSGFSLFLLSQAIIPDQVLMKFVRCIIFFKCSQYFYEMKK